jgi:hypothetical protein
MQIKYQHLNKKLQKLRDQTNHNETRKVNKDTFYTRIINLTNTVFTDEETLLG